MDVTRFRRHISTSSYRPFVTVGNWPKPGIHLILVNARFRCIAEVHPAPLETFNLNVGFG
jgi:hypothetical protein